MECLIGRRWLQLFKVFEVVLKVTSEFLAQVTFQPHLSFSIYVLVLISGISRIGFHSLLEKPDGSS